ncbi:hypothetical protein Cgig2_001697 [Carnegiea gigantea]|uniref:WRKY domain-containing protein n=1 Tax=Carnegiea gigantea TaxID=171969 RepID=A0A9Q1JN49_9CARY|nr:hypothetical protein Cgig2_001697 [Carnegiea gigantea]
MDAQEFLLSSSSSDHALMQPYNAVVEDHDHHQIMTTMMIPSHNHGHGNDDDHEFMIPTNSSSSSVSANNNNMLFSPLLPMQTPQTPYTLDNIDWVSLLSPPTPAEVAPFELISLPMASSSSPVPTINSSSSNNDNDNDNNKNNNNGGGGGGGGHDHQMRGDRSMAEINGGGSSNNSKGNRGGLSSSSSYNSSNYNNSTMKKKGVTPRVAFYTKSDEDVLDDGYKWRKYGQKSVKNTVHPRSYYRCTYHTCNVKKQIQRHSRDKSIVITTYEGIHNHPSEKLMETLGPLLKQLQFLSRF